MLQSQEIQWFVIHTRPNQEKKVKDILANEQTQRSNILDFYCPMNTTVRVQRGKQEEMLPLFAGRVFVLTTQDTARAILGEKYPEGYLEYDKTQKRVMTVPDLQMLFFMDFNEHYPEKVLVLERPYSDYAFNAKNDEPNEAIKVIDGPFEGKTGYLVRFRGNRRLVFQMEGMAISIPDIWDYHLTRLHNSEGDRQSRHTLKARIVDLIVGKLQDSGFADNAYPTFIWLINTLIERGSFAGLQEEIGQHADRETYRRLAESVRNLSVEEAEQIQSLANYIKTDPEFADSYKDRPTLRPFLTPTPGIRAAAGKDYAVCRHKDYTEMIRKVTFLEDTFFPKEDLASEAPTSYYAHVGVLRKKNNRCAVFINFDKILREYFLLGGQAKAKQLDTFKTYAPLLHQVLKGEHTVKAEKELAVGTETFNALCIQTATDIAEEGKELSEQHDILAALDTLTETGRRICQEINGSTHLAIWRKYLREIWLHH